jgi:hypothetical protein
MRLAPSKPSVTTLSGGAFLVESERGVAHLSHLRPGVVLCTCQGYLATSFYEPMVAVAQREFDATGKLVMAVDGWELHSVETGFRESWTRWFKEHKDRFGMKLLVRTRLMEMAASLANLFTGIRVIATYSDVGTWERAVGHDVPGFRRAPPLLKDRDVHASRREEGRSPPPSASRFR